MGVQLLCLLALLLATDSTIATNEPALNPVNDVVCDDDDTTNCESVAFTGTDFDTADTYKCQVQYYELNSTAQLVATTTAEFNATSVTDTGATCVLPDGKSAQVTLFSTNLNKALDSVNVVFAPECLDCNAQFSCNPNSNGCFIDSACQPTNTFVGGNLSQICDPSQDFFGPSPIPADALNFHARSCGRAWGVRMNKTEEGLISEEFAIAPASYAINLNFVARLSCNSSSEIVLAEFPPGIRIVQNGDKVLIQLKFVNGETGEKKEEEEEIDVKKSAWRLIGRRARQWRRQRRLWRWRRFRKCMCLGRRRHWRRLNRRIFWPHWYTRASRGWFRRCRGQQDCSLAVSFRHNPADGETSLIVNGKNTGEDFGNTEGFQLLTTGSAYISREVISCLQINNNVNNRCGNRRRTLGCFRYVCRRRKCPCANANNPTTGP